MMVVDVDTRAECQSAIKGWSEEALARLWWWWERDRGAPRRQSEIGVVTKGGEGVCSGGGWTANDDITPRGRWRRPVATAKETDGGERRRRKREEEGEGNEGTDGKMDQRATVMRRQEARVATTARSAGAGIGRCGMKKIR